MKKHSVDIVLSVTDLYVKQIYHLSREDVIERTDHAANRLRKLYYTLLKRNCSIMNNTIAELFQKSPCTVSATIKSVKYDRLNVDIEQVEERLNKLSELDINDMFLNELMNIRTKIKKAITLIDSFPNHAKTLLESI